MTKLKKNCKERVSLLEKVTLYESHILSGTVPESSGCQQVGTKNSVSISNQFSCIKGRII